MLDYISRCNLILGNKKINAVKIQVTLAHTEQ